MVIQLRRNLKWSSLVEAPAKSLVSLSVMKRRKSVSAATGLLPPASAMELHRLSAVRLAVFTKAMHALALKAPCITTGTQIRVPRLTSWARNRWFQYHCNCYFRNTRHMKALRFITRSSSPPSGSLIWVLKYPA